MKFAQTLRFTFWLVYVGLHNLIASIPEALAVTDIVCSSVSVGSTKCGINMDAVAQMGRVVKMAAERTADRDAIGCAKLVVFCNAVPDNPFMAGAFHGVTEPETVINVGVSGPGVVNLIADKDSKLVDMTCEGFAEETASESPARKRLSARPDITTFR